MDVAPSRFLLVVAVFVGLGWRSSSPIHEAGNSWGVRDVSEVECFQEVMVIPM